MNSKDYWAERARLDKIKVIKTGEKGIDNLKRLLKLNLDDVEKKIKDFYDKYGDNPAEKLTYAEFEKYKQKLRQKAKKYPKDKTLQKLAKQDIPKYKIDRLRALQIDLQMQLTEATAGQEAGIYKTLVDVGAVSQATIAKRFSESLGLEFNTIASRKMKQLISSDWSGATWSERLWKDRAKVGEKLTNILEKGIPQGTSLQKMSRELKQATGQSFNDAFRLIRTETSHIDSMVTLDRYKQAQEEFGQKLKYKYDAFLDDRTSKICRELNNKTFWVDEAEVGKNYPPMHPNCRSTTQLLTADIDPFENVDLWKEGKNPDKNRKQIENFVDGVINNNMSPKVNDVVVGDISSNVKRFLKQQNINIEKESVKLTYKKVEHALRDNKNPLQKVTPEQLKRVGFIIQNNNVFFDTEKNNLIFIAELPSNEIKNGRNWIKVPVNVKQYNNIATVSIIPEDSITKNKRYKKID